MTGAENVHGEEVRKLDEYAHDVMFNAMDHNGQLCVMASEEEEGLIQIPAKFPTGDYVLLFDPLDGSSNIDANISIGTIFSIHRRITEGRDGTLEDCLQPGYRQVAAGYVMYGSSTVMVYTTGQGVAGFTLDPSIGEFLLSHREIRIPEPGKRIYSSNEGNYARWSEGQKALVDHFRGDDGNGGDFSHRYVGSLVADFHRTLLYGGIFMYPADSKSLKGKLRLLYEAAPLAMICEQAGGRATDGVREATRSGWISPPSISPRRRRHLPPADRPDGPGWSAPRRSPRSRRDRGLSSVGSRILPGHGSIRRRTACRAESVCVRPRRTRCTDRPFRHHRNRTWSPRS
jgi:fructose-1,6-bisphosphatase I